MNILRTAVILACKDLRILGRARHAMVMACALGAMSVVVLAIGLGAGLGTSGVSVGDHTSVRVWAVVWAALLFGSVLCFERSAWREHECGAIDAIRLARVEPGAVYLGKLLANLAVIGVLCICVTLAGLVLIGSSMGGASGALVVVLGLSVIGLSAMGTLLSAGLGSGRHRSELLAVLLFPLVLPLVIASIRAMERAMGGAGTDGIGTLAAIDVVYVTMGWLTYGLAMEA